MKKKTMSFRVFKISILIIAILTFLFANYAYSIEIPMPPGMGGSASVPYNIFGGLVEYRMVNLTSPWNFLGDEWEGHLKIADNPDKDDNHYFGENKGYYPYWDYELKYLLAQIRSMKDKNINMVRIYASKPYNQSLDAIDALSGTYRDLWWSDDEAPPPCYLYSGKGDMDMDGFTAGGGAGTSDFQDADYLREKDGDDWTINSTHWDPFKEDELFEIYQSWDRLFELLDEIKAGFNDEIYVDLCFNLGRTKGKCPILTTDQHSEYDQDFDTYWNGAHWLLFKTFYDRCMEKIDKIQEEDPQTEIDTVDELMNYYNIVLVELQNEGDNGVYRYDADQYLLYPNPQATPLPEIYYEDNDDLLIAPDEEKYEKRSVEMQRHLIDYAKTVVGDQDGYIGISHDKLSYGFTAAQNVKLFLDVDGADEYLLDNLNWHMYSSLLTQGLGQDIDWLRATMNGWNDVSDYRIILGEIGFYYDYRLSNFGKEDGDQTNPEKSVPYEPYGEAGVDYTGYDRASFLGYHYLDIWLNEAENFADEAKVNIWPSTQQDDVPLSTVGIWATSDAHMITEDWNYVWRWGLFETFDTNYRKPEWWTPTGGNAGYLHDKRARRKIIAPMSRHAAHAIFENWWKTTNYEDLGPWKAGDNFNNAFLITKESAGAVEMMNYTIEDSSPTDGLADLRPSSHTTPGGADIWFRCKIPANIWSPQQTCFWDVDGPANTFAGIYNYETEKWLDEFSSPSGELICQAPNAVPSSDYHRIYFYVWVPDPTGAQINFHMFLETLEE